MDFIRWRCGHCSPPRRPRRIGVPYKVRRFCLGHGTVSTHDFLNAFGSQFPCSLYIFQRLAGSFRFLFYINQRVKKWFRIRV
jgi:hypothetical protein